MFAKTHALAAPGLTDDCVGRDGSQLLHDGVPLGDRALTIGENDAVFHVVDQLLIEQAFAANGELGSSDTNVRGTPKCISRGGL